MIANRDAAGSIELAEYYMGRRGIPRQNLLVLQTTTSETCSREEYEKRVLPPLRKLLKQKEFRKRIRCLVTMYGLPLRVASPPLLPEEKGKKGQNGEHGAAFDSELALALVDHYPLAGWVPNPFFVGNQGKWVDGMPEKGHVMMVSRLDGPDTATVRRVIDDSIQAEKEGLSGKGFFDARWPKPSEEERKKQTGMGYDFYDASIHEAAEVVRKDGAMPVVVNDKEALFGPGECTDAALYCGWYSLGKYVDAFKWRPGAVGYHIASGECATLKQPGSQVWCKRMLEEGVAATVGPVNEPYVQAFPVPEIFFQLFVGGYWSLAECYALSLPFWSWQMVLIGDPMYKRKQ